MMQLLNIFLLCLISYTASYAQVTSVVYSEDFNSGPNGWIIGGYNPSWKHGIPTLPNIISNGTACFATGDAGVATGEPFNSCLPVSGPTTNGNFYNCCERSFVESPVIDLSTVNSPMISIDINLHCEQSFDGTKLQVSINGGSSWLDVGSYTSIFYQQFPSSINCREQNWYNKNAISYLSNTSGGCGSVNYSFGGSNSGWSGGCAQAASGACDNPDNHGTNGWITATHCLTQAANKGNVKIRVVFGAGSQVYSDGIAFDNVTISDVYPVVEFSETQVISCDAEMAFINNSDCAASYSWDFGHPGSQGNTSSASNPDHIFPQAGNYLVSLSATDFCGGVSSFSKSVNVINGSGPVIATIEATSWGLCSSSIDTISIFLSGIGQPPYEISYLKDGVTESVQGLTGNPLLLTNLAPGVYSQVVITDDSGCVFQSTGNVVIPENSDGISVFAGDDQFIDAGNSVQLSAYANMPAGFVWSPDLYLDNPFDSITISTPGETISYTVTATSQNGCTDSDQVTVYVSDQQPCNRYFIPNAFTPNGDGKNDRLIFITDPTMNLEYFNLAIYNRWGIKVFQSSNQNAGWDGGSHPMGVYAVIVNLKCENKKTEYITGVINLVR